MTEWRTVASSDDDDGVVDNCLLGAESRSYEFMRSSTCTWMEFIGSHAALVDVVPGKRGTIQADRPGEVPGCIAVQ
jgi:hypothetical protein